MGLFVGVVKMPRKKKAKAFRTLISFPQDQKRWIKETAARDFNSQNSVVLSCVQAKIDAESKPRKSRKSSVSA
jgi:hypothetical protein